MAKVNNVPGKTSVESRQPGKRKNVAFEPEPETSEQKQSIEQRFGAGEEDGGGQTRKVKGLTQIRNRLRAGAQTEQLRRESEGSEGNGEDALHSRDSRGKKQVPAENRGQPAEPKIHRDSAAKNDER